MQWFRKKNKLPEVEAWGLRFKHPVGFRPAATGRRLWGNWHGRIPASFVTLTSPKEDILPWIGQLQQYRNRTVLAVNLSNDIARSFSLVYDFADLIIIEPDSDNGIGAPDISDTTQLMDEITSLRLCYERYTPVLLRFSHGISNEDMLDLLASCRLFGIDGAVAPGAEKVRLLQTETLGRLPIIGAATTVEEALACLCGGATLTEVQMSPILMNKVLKNLTLQ